MFNGGKGYKDWLLNKGRSEGARAACSPERGLRVQSGWLFSGGRSEE